MKYTVQGKCPKCRLAYRWPKQRKNPKLSQAACPKCNGRLQATTRNLKWSWVERKTMPFFTHGRIHYRRPRVR